MLFCSLRLLRHFITFRNAGAIKAPYHVVPRQVAELLLFSKNLAMKGGLLVIIIHIIILGRC